MEISVTNAKSQLTDLVRRAEAGEEVTLTRHGQPAARIIAARAPLDQAARRAIIESVRRSAALKPATGEDAAHSQDFLYDENGLPK